MSYPGTVFTAAAIIVSILAWQWPGRQRHICGGGMKGSDVFRSR